MLLLFSTVQVNIIPAMPVNAVPLMGPKLHLGFSQYACGRVTSALILKTRNFTAFCNDDYRMRKYKPSRSNVGIVS